jgi:hypothetical protein
MNDTKIKPEVGMGATIGYHSDRHAATIVEVINGKTVVVQQDTATRTDTNGYSESQKYTFGPCPTAPRKTFTLRNNGRWVEKGTAKQHTPYLVIGHRSEYYDFSF